MAVTSYTMVEGDSVAELQAAVAVKIAAGYQPYGFPIVRDHEGRSKLVQAMVQGAPVTADDQFDDTSVLARLDALEATVDTATTGLSDVVADHETRIAALEP